MTRVTAPRQQLLPLLQLGHVTKGNYTKTRRTLHHWQHLSEPTHDKTNKMTVRPAKTQISLGIRPVWSESSLCALLVAQDPSVLQADSEDSDQTRRMPRLIWVFAGRKVILLVLSCCGSFYVVLWSGDLEYILWAIPHKNDVVTFGEMKCYVCLYSKWSSSHLKLY